MGSNRFAQLHFGKAWIYHYSGYNNFAEIWKSYKGIYTFHWWSLTLLLFLRIIHGFNPFSRGPQPYLSPRIVSIIVFWLQMTKTALLSSCDERQDGASGSMEKVSLKVSFKHFDFGLSSKYTDLVQLLCDLHLRLFCVFHISQEMKQGREIQSSFAAYFSSLAITPRLITLLKILQNTRLSISMNLNQQWPGLFLV